MGQPETFALSAGVQALEERLQASSTLPFDCDVLVVGSGYGGAVAAARLAKALRPRGCDAKPGTGVVLLERGHEHSPGSFPSQWGDLVASARVFMQPTGQHVGLPSALLDLRVGPDVTVLVGNGLGGGSLINAGVMAEPDPRVWRDGWPRPISERGMRSHYEKARAALLPRARDDVPTPTKYHVLADAAKRMGAVIERAPVTVNLLPNSVDTSAGVALAPCTRCGDCMTGCNQGAKGSLDTNYLATAKRHGARFHCGAWVEYVEPLRHADGTGWSARWHATDKRVRERQCFSRIRARHVVLAAGALGSTEILLRSKKALWPPDSAKQDDRRAPPRLGQGFSGNGDAAVLVLGHPEGVGTGAEPGSDPGQSGAREVGPTINGIVRVPEGFLRKAFVAEEFAVPAALRELFGEVAFTLNALKPLQVPQSDPFALTEGVLDRMSLYGVMQADEALGVVTLPDPPQAKPSPAHDAAEGCVRLHWGSDGHPARGNAQPKGWDWRHVQRWFERAMPGRVVLSPYSALAQFLPRITVHPLGGCAMGDSGATGVVNHLGQVFKGSDTDEAFGSLVVLDGAIVPKALGINPALTITALAERAVTDLAQQWFHAPAAAEVAQVAWPHAAPPCAAAALPLRAARRRRELPWPQADWALREQQQGCIELKGQPHWAQLELDFHALPGMRRALALQRRTMGLKRATLKLWRLDRKADAFTVDEARLAGKADVVAQLTGSAELFAPAPPCSHAATSMASEHGGLPERLKGYASRIALWAAGYAPLPRQFQTEHTWMRYALSVQAVMGNGCDVLRVGDRLDGLKEIGGPQPASETARGRGLLRQYSEMAITVNGQPAGHLELNMRDLALRQSLLFRANRLSSWPDAAGDLAALPLYLLRRAAGTIAQEVDLRSMRPARAKAAPALGTLANTQRRHTHATVAKTLQEAVIQLLRPTLAQLAERLMQLPQGRVADDLLPIIAERLPGQLNAQVMAPNAAFYGGQGWHLARYMPQEPSKSLPIVLIHGLGTSGSSFTHPAIGHNLASYLLAEKRDVWVLDVRSSIANCESHATEQDPAWTVEDMCVDIIEAVGEIKHRTGHTQVDVVAHCMGAVMFCLAVLQNQTLATSIHAAVLSQVGLRVRMSPLNQLRALVAGNLHRHLGVKNLDVTPDYVVSRQQPWRYEQVKHTSPYSRLAEALLLAFPYPADDPEPALRAEDDKKLGGRLHKADFFNIRHRADMIFGQLFELRNLSVDTCAAAAALFGWVKVPMLAQAIHFAQTEMLTDANGRSPTLDPAALAKGFAFPVRIIHGQRNRVFDWRGSKASVDMLLKLRGEQPPEPMVCTPLPPPPVPLSGHTLYGQQCSAQLLLLHGYGHMDCIIGEHAHLDVFPHILNFLSAPAKALGSHAAPRLRARVPWVGPHLGWLRTPAAGQHGRLLARVVVHGNPIAAPPFATLVLPLPSQAGPLTAAHWAQARVFDWLPWQRSDRSCAMDWLLDLPHPDTQAAAFLVLTLHDELTQNAAGNTAAPSLHAAGGSLLLNGRPATYGEARAAVRWVRQNMGQPGTEEAVVHLSNTVQQGADRGAPLPQASHLRMALSSCQYNASMVDRGPAQATWDRLLDDLRRPDAPQCQLLMGDQVYMDAAVGQFEAGVVRRGGDRVSEIAVNATYDVNWRLPSFRKLGARLPTYTMLDDHEVYDNWPGVHATPPHKKKAVDLALKGFDRYQGALAPVRQRLAPRSDNHSYFVYPAGIPLFVVDTRSYRSPRTALSIGASHLVDPQTLKALIKRLQDSAIAELPKLVVLPVPLLPPPAFEARSSADALHRDDWDGFPASARALMRAIAARNIRKVVFLSGDSHLSSVTRFSFHTARYGANSIVCVVSSGSYTPWPFANEKPVNLCLEGQVRVGGIAGSMSLHAVSAESGYAWAEVAPLHQGAQAHRLSVELRGGSGATVRCELTLA